MTCPECNSEQTNTRWRVEEMPYGDTHSILGKVVLLRVVIPVRECLFCGLEWTDHVADIARGNAIQRHHRMIDEM